MKPYYIIIKTKEELQSVINILRSKGYVFTIAQNVSLERYIPEILYIVVRTSNAFTYGPKSHYDSYPSYIPNSAKGIPASKFISQTDLSTYIKNLISKLENL